VENEKANFREQQRVEISHRTITLGLIHKWIVKEQTFVLYQVVAKTMSFVTAFSVQTVARDEKSICFRSQH